MKRGRNIISYLPHDSNARNNDKVIELRIAHGAAGYGVYFMILERLREEAEYVSRLRYAAIAYDLRVDEELVRSVINDFGLFEVNEKEGTFFSHGLLDRMTQKERCSEMRSRAGSKGAEARWNIGANAVQPLDTLVDNGQTILSGENSVPNMANVIKVDGKSMANAIKVDGKSMVNANENDSSNTSNTSKQVSNTSTTRTCAREAADAAERENISLLFFTRGFADVNGEVQRFYDHYESQGWLKSNGQPVRNRVALAGSWQPKNTTPKFESWACEVMQAISKAMYVATADRMSLMTISKITCDGDKIKFYCKRRFADALEYTVNAGKAGPVKAVIAKYAHGGIEYKINDVRTGV